jgi:hypothetical protein
MAKPLIFDAERGICRIRRKPRLTNRFPAIAICNKCRRRHAGFFDTLGSEHDRHAARSERSSRQEKYKVKKIVPFIAAAALGVGLTTAAQAHVSVGIGIGIPVAPAYPVYAAPPPAYYAPPPPPVVYAPPPVVYAPPPVVVGGYYGYHRPYYHHGYYGRPYYRY